MVHSKAYLRCKLVLYLCYMHGWTNNYFNFLKGEREGVEMGRGVYTPGKLNL